eukprot:754387-Hanusia_phi.AAC.1
MEARVLHPAGCWDPEMSAAESSEGRPQGEILVETAVDCDGYGEKLLRRILHLEVDLAPPGQDG